MLDQDPRSVVLVQHGLQGRVRQAEDVSQLEHQLAEATEALKQSVAANNELSAKIAKEAAERELAQGEVAEVRRQLDAERSRAELKKLAKERGEKLAASVAEVAALQTAKEQVEADELMRQCFERAVRQAHVLYGRIMPSAEAATLTAQETEPAGTQEGEAEVQEGEAAAEEGECVEIQD
ncbi:hypothetical protein VNO80_19789 [Phaseolus coccineus]|uniref:Uncharacterized protein n=1 Tax=Phaseolus coccineus TaxID=3886 RepID=A0AAN9MGT0_PHACN